MPGNITIIMAQNDLYHFQFRSLDGESLLTGEFRPDKDRVLEDADILQRCVQEDGCYAVARDEQGRFFFHFIGSSGETLGISAVYPTPEGLGRAIASLKACVPWARVVDRT